MHSYMLVFLFWIKNYLLICFRFYSILLTLELARFPSHPYVYIRATYLAMVRQWCCVAKISSVKSEETEGFFSIWSLRYRKML